MSDNETYPGRLFGMDVMIDPDLAPGIIEVYGPRFEEPYAWHLMDNAARLSWMRANAAVTFLVGEGTTEDMLMPRGES
jgi:hypothetical protein